jgi:hypothetical protein
MIHAIITYSEQLMLQSFALSNVLVMKRQFYKVNVKTDFIKNSYFMLNTQVNNTYLMPQFQG